MRRVVAVGALAVWLSACGDEDPCGKVGGIELEVGAGTLVTGFLPVTEGDEVGLELGPQGLHMYVMALRTDGLAMQGAGGQPVVDMYMEADVGEYGYELAAGFYGRPMFAPRPEGGAELLGIRLIADVEGDQLNDRRVCLTTIVTDESGGRAESRMAFTSVRKDATPGSCGPNNECMNDPGAVMPGM